MHNTNVVRKYAMIHDTFIEQGQQAVVNIVYDFVIMYAFDIKSFHPNWLLAQIFSSTLYLVIYILHGLNYCFYCSRHL